MPMKIWWQDVFPEKMKIAPDMKQQYYESLRKGFQKVALEDTTVEIHHVKSSPYILDTIYLESKNNQWVIDGIIEAERRGYDAAIIGCGNDPGLYEARQAVDIPVIGLTESALLLACSLATRIGIVAVSEGCAAIVEDRIHRYRLDAKIAFPIQVYKLADPFTDLFKAVTQRGNINPQFEELCRKCIDNGAEIIIPACAALSPAATLDNYKEVPGTGVPVLDINEIGVKTAEMQVDLMRFSGVKKSQKGLFKSIKPAARDRMRELAQVAN